MTDRARLASAHLEDLAIVTVAAAPGSVAASLYPSVDDTARSKLRARLKQFSRHQWPASLTEDPKLRRGYTVRQCFRLVSAIVLIDAQLGPTKAVAIAAANERVIMREMVRAIDEGPSSLASDTVAVCVAGDISQIVDEAGVTKAKPLCLRWLRRDSLADLWSANADLDCTGPRVVLDFSTPARAVWRWIAERRLVPGDELELFRQEVMNEVVHSENSTDEQIGR
jgi:hypothetical protein